MKIQAATLLLVPALVLSAGGKHKRHNGHALNEKEAKAIAARETGGVPVTAHEIPLNGASGGWEVDLHMANEDRGWRCIIDDDTRMVHTKTRIPNPELSGRGRRKR